MYRFLSIVLMLCCLPTGSVFAEEKPTGKSQGPPPMLVAVAEIVAGKAEPMQELAGSVFYARVSNVAAEVAGLVGTAVVEEGDRVKKGAPLVSLQTDLLATTISKTRNAYEQARIDRDQADRDLKRLESLHSDNLIAETTYDSQLAKAHGLEKQVAGFKADLDRLLLEKEKMTIRAPFAGVVLERKVELGEWVNAGGMVAVVGDDSEVDIIVDIPERLIPFMEKGRTVGVSAAGRQLDGILAALVPRGDLATRTFTVKIRLKNRAGLIEGMTATASLPSGPSQEGLLVPRDAVIKQQGRQVVYVADDGKAKQVSVTVNGYQGMQVAVTGEGLNAGQPVVVKGNERIRDGQPIRF